LECHEALCQAYAEKHRHYHTQIHINAMLRHFDETTVIADYPHEVELAIWFHDAIYKPFSSTNEKDSANWAQDFLLKLKYNEAGIVRVGNLIMATMHQRDVSVYDEQLIVDIDLTILGSPAHIYDQFEQNIRKEYRKVPTFIYRKKRKQLLQGFLNQNNIYHLDYFRSQYEQLAKDNITRAINTL